MRDLVLRREANTRSKEDGQQNLETNDGTRNGVKNLEDSQTTVKSRFLSPERWGNHILRTMIA